MVATLDELNARLSTLKAALATGASLVQHGDKRVQYRSIAEIRAAIGAVEQDIALLGGAAVIRSYKLTSSKDL